MKSILRMMIIGALMLCLYGCGQKEAIGGYKYASYDELATSTSAEYSSAGKDIYIEGTLKGFETMSIDDVDYLTATVEEKAGNNWKVRIGQVGACSDERLTDKIGTKIRCFGDFLKNEGDTPVLALNIENDYCIQECKGNKTICNADILKPTSIYVMKWYDDNADEVIVQDVYDVLGKVKKTGAYVSRGIIGSLEDGDNTFTFYQKDGDSFAHAFIDIAEDPIAVTSLQDIKKDMKDGDAIKLYYIVDEKGFMHVVDYASTTVDYTYNEDDAKFETVFDKEYAWGGDCHITYKVYYSKAGNSYHYDVEALAKDYDSANAASFWYLLVFSENDADFTLNVKIKDTNEGFQVLNSGSLKNMLWLDKKGEVLIDAPSWFNVSETTDAMAKALIGIMEIDEQFEKDYGYDFK